MAVLKPYEALLDTNPLLRLVLPFMLGILFGEMSFDYFEGWSSAFLISAGVAILFCIFIYRFKGEVLRKFFLFFSIVSVSMFMLGAGSQISVLEQLQTTWPRDAMDLRILITETPKETDKIWQVTAEILGGDFTGKKLRVGLLKTEKENDSLKNKTSHTFMEHPSKDDVLRVGDALLIHAQVRTPQNAGNPNEFDFANWARHQGVAGTVFCFPNQWKISENPAQSLPVTVSALRWRDRWVDRYEKFFAGRNLAVLSAMTLGDKTRLDSETRDVFSQTGVSHVLALSGLHLSILFFIFQKLVLSRCRKRWLMITMSIIGIGGLWIFALLAGFPLSLIRAAVMFSIVQLMGCLRHDSFPINNLAFAALLLLMISPQSLFDVGFQLSFLSVFCILLFVNSFECPVWMSKYRLLRSGYALVAVSCCAQLGTAPLVAYYFHTFPLFNIVANFVAIPLAYAILALSVLFFALPFLQPYLAVLLGIFLEFMDGALSLFAQLPGAVLELYPSRGTVVLVYLFFFLFIGYCTRRRVLHLYTSLLVLCLIIGWEFYVHRPQRLEPQLVFYNLRNVPAVHALASSECSYIWSSHCEKADTALRSVKRTWWPAENIASPLYLDTITDLPNIYYDGRVMVFNGCRIGLCFGRLPDNQPVAPLSVNYLLLARGVRADLKQIIKYYKPQQIILDASLTDFYYKKYKKETRNSVYPCYDIKESGALIVKF